MSTYKNNINKVIYKIIIFLITFYQKIISPVIPARCRYYPTCSHYGKQAIAWHGVWRGGWLLLKRLGRCQPWGGHGVDFVPLPLDSYHYKPSAPFLTNSSVSAQLDNSSSGYANGVYRDHSSYVARLNYLMRQN